MQADWQAATALARHCGFSHAVLLPARVLSEYVPNAEGIRQRIDGDPFRILPGAQSILVAARPFAWFAPWPKNYGEVSAFYFQSQAAHEGIRTLRARFEALGAKARDAQSLPAKLLGRDAGFGLLGQNSLLQNDAWGSCFTLRALVTDIPPQPSIAPMAAKPCGACRACIRACPSGALLGNGALDTERCIRTHMMRGEVIPAALRGGMEGRLLGCEICQRVCPHNALIPSLLPPDTAAFTTERLLRGSRADLDAIAGAIGWNEARLQRVQAQAAIVAGNQRNPAYLPALRALAAHTRPAIAAHAQWAIHQIEGSQHDA